MLSLIDINLRSDIFIHVIIALSTHKLRAHALSNVHVSLFLYILQFSKISFFTPVLRGLQFALGHTDHSTNATSFKTISEINL